MKRIIIAFALALVCIGASAQTVTNTATRTTKPSTAKIAKKNTAKIAKKKPVKLERTKRDVPKLDESRELKLNRDTKVCKEERPVIADTSKVKKRRITPKKPIKRAK